MVRQRVQKSDQRSSQPQESTTAPVLTQRHSPSPHTQQDTESRTIQQHQREATVLKIQAKHGTITPQGQERLTFLQAKMADDTQRKLNFGDRTHQNMLSLSGGDVSVTPPERKTAPIQAKLTIGQPGDKYEQEADRVAEQFVKFLHAPTTQQSEPNQPVQREMIPEALQRKPMLQLQADASGVTAAPELETAINQARSGGQPLAESIKKPAESFLGVDLSGVKVHTDARSHQLNRSIQARAFTTGNHIFFGKEHNFESQEGMETAMHELTHTQQQSGGAVQRMAKLGKLGEKKRGVREHSPKGMILQRVVAVGGAKMTADQLWAQVVNTPYFQSQPISADADMKRQARDILKQWEKAPSESINPFATSENRKYQNADAVARALIGELNASDEKQRERALSEAIWKDEGVRKKLNGVMLKIKTLNEIPNQGRYWWHYGNILGTLQRAVANWDEKASIEATIALILDVGYAMRSKVGDMLEKQRKSRETLSQPMTDARKGGGHWNPNELADWTKLAREQGKHLSAGPSATMGQTLRLARALNANLAELSAVAKAGAAFWNLVAKRHQSGIHTFHEVMEVFSFHAELIQREQETA